jgi:ubiquinone/menaquinone biosynthesis C-methylase UbiE
MTSMAQHVCPWWLGYILVNPLRRLFEKPADILAPYVSAGMTVLEPGPGMGYFTLDLLRLVGSGGRVVAVDVQDRMLRGLRRRVDRAGLLKGLDARLAQSASLGVADLKGRVDFVFAFYVVHELPDAGAFFAEANAALKPTGRVWMVEPSGHVSEAQFDEELRAAVDSGLFIAARPKMRRGRAALLAKAMVG